MRTSSRYKKASRGGRLSGLASVETVALNLHTLAGFSGPDYPQGWPRLLQRLSPILADAFFFGLAHSSANGSWSSSGPSRIVELVQ